MSKPLELTIYPPIPSNPRPKGPMTRMHPLYEKSVDWDRERELEGRLSRRKRLTEAELAAEWWRAEWTTQYDANRGPGSKQCELGETDKTQTLHRFATTPHYFEAP